MNASELHDRPLIFSAAQLRLIDKCLLRLADHTAAPLVMLTDISGQLIHFRGRISAAHSTGLAALSAASFAASAEISRFLGLQETFVKQLHEGKVVNLYAVAIGDELLLVMAFSRSTMLGLVRLFAEQAQAELLQVAEAARTAMASDEPAGRLPEAVGAAIRDQLDTLFVADEASDD